MDWYWRRAATAKMGEIIEDSTMSTSVPMVTMKANSAGSQWRNPSLIGRKDSDGGEKEPTCTSGVVTSRSGLGLDQETCSGKFSETISSSGRDSRSVASGPKPTVYSLGLSSQGAWAVTVSPSRTPSALARAGESLRESSPVLL